MNNISEKDNPLGIEVGDIVKCFEHLKTGVRYSDGVCKAATARLTIGRVEKGRVYCVDHVNGPTLVIYVSILSGYLFEHPYYLTYKHFWHIVSLRDQYTTEIFYKHNDPLIKELYGTDR